MKYPGILIEHIDGQISVRRYSAEDRALRRADRENRTIRMSKNGVDEFYTVKKRAWAPGGAMVRYVLTQQP